MIAAAYVIAAVGIAATVVGARTLADQHIPPSARGIAGPALLLVGMLLIITSMAVGWPR